MLFFEIWFLGGFLSAFAILTTGHYLGFSGPVSASYGSISCSSSKSRTANSQNATTSHSILQRSSSLLSNSSSIASSATRMNASTTSTPRCGNSTFNLWCLQPGTCWDHLDQHNGWNLCNRTSLQTVTSTKTLIEIIFTTETQILPPYVTTKTIYAPGGTIPVYTLTTTYEMTITGTDEATEFPTATSTFVTTQYSCVPTNLLGFKPTCTPAPDTARCESQWNKYISTSLPHPSSAPWCTWGSLDAKQCEVASKSVFSERLTFGTADPIRFLFGGRRPLPTDMYALGCTFGCQQCSMTGDRVRLLYWPPETATNTIPGASSEVVAYVDGTTLTSPTLYVSYRTLFAADSCSFVGPTSYTNTIIPLPNNQLSSLAYQALNYTDTSSNLDRRDPTLDPIAALQWTYSTVSFNLSDLIEPIPQSIYNQLPACVASSRKDSFFDLPTAPCPTTISYEPLIAIPPEITILEPEWASCTPWYGGLYDPPSTLHRNTIISTVTTPHDPHATPTPASPSSAIASLPTETGKKQPTAIFTAGGKTFTAVRPAPTATDVSIIVDKTTVELHSGTENIGGLIFTFQPSNAGIVVGTQTIEFPTETQTFVPQSETMVASSQEVYTILVPHSTQTPKIVENESMYVSNHRTYTVDVPGRPQSQSDEPMSITIGSQIITENAQSRYVISSQTLAPGSAIIVNGATYSLASDGTELFAKGKASSAIPAASNTPNGTFQTESEQQTATTTNEMSPSRTSGHVKTHTPKTHKGAASSVELQYTTLGLALILALVASL